MVRVVPVVNAAEKRRVASMSPSKIKAVCVGRRGMFLTAILKEVLSRAPRKARIRAPAAKMPRRASGLPCELKKTVEIFFLKSRL